MKKIALYVLIAAGALWMTSSCTNDYLDVKYYNIVNPDGVYEDPDNVLMGLMGVYNTLYLVKNYYQKPQPALANLPALDLQADGWDAEMSTHSWTVDSKSNFFGSAWENSYIQVSRANTFLRDLEESVKDEVVPPAKKKIYEAEARFIRAYAYFFLTINFSRVPMLLTGENYATAPNKARPENDEAAWKLIKEDFEFAASVLDWSYPDGMIGRATKTAALAYAAKVNMYLGDFQTAKAQLKEVIDKSGKKLNPCHGMLHWLDNPDSEETVWEVAFPQFPNMSSSGSKPYRLNYDYRYFGKQTRAHEYGGNGDAPITYEYCRSIEPGDKRLMYNVAQWYGDHGDINPYTGDEIGKSASYRDYFMSGYEGMPNNHGMKWWKDDEYYSAFSVQLYRYTEVLLNYAECCFETGDDATGWKQLNDIRNRAWGNLEVGYDPDKSGSSFKFPKSLLNTATVAVPDAQTYYTKYAKKEAGAYLGVSWESQGIPVWKVALTQERRKEFVQEFCFWYDLSRMKLVEAWLNSEYPKNGGASFYNTKTGKYYVSSSSDLNEPWKNVSAEERANMIPVHHRDWDWNPIHLVYPIPTTELTANPLCEQNPGY